MRFRTRKHFALLIRLALDPGRRVTRDALIELLWPDVPAHHARHSLAQAVSVLKGKLGREHLQVQKSTLALNADVVDTDVAQLDGCDVDIRGTVLEGFDIPGAAAFEHWKDEWRARLAPRIRDSLVKQMDAGRRIGDFATVERSAQLLYDLEPLSEDAVRGLMEARAWAGDRTNALKIYNRFVAALGEDLGAKPSPDLARIADLLRDGRSSGLRVRETAAEPRRERRFEAETLIGREKEFAALYDNWVEARQRRPRVVVLTGDAGIGKTTLTNAFLSSCQMEGAVVARAQAYEAERDLPFAVLAELVRQLALQRAIGCADPEVLSELGRISPAIFEAFPGVPRPIEWAAEVTPIRLADALLKAVAAAGDETPLILVVDDIHAADNASAAILHAVARKLETTRVLIIVAGRPTELHMSSATAALTADQGIIALQVVELESLSESDALDLVSRHSKLAIANDEEIPARSILRAGNGNPLAIELLTKEWVTHGPDSLLRALESLDTIPVPSVGIPRAVRRLFDRQVQRLDSVARAVLDLAAVVGRRLSEISLYTVIDCSYSMAVEALSRLRSEGLLRDVGGELEFRNELIRAQAYYAVTAAVRQHLHRRTAQVLSGSTSGTVQDLEVAWHFARGGDWDSAVKYAIGGSERALSLGAPYEAERILTRVRHEIGSVSEFKDEIDLLLARAFLDQSKAHSAIPLLDELRCSCKLSDFQKADTARLRAAAEYLLSREQGESYCRAARHALEAARHMNNPLLIGGALFEWARSGAETGDVNRVGAALDELLALSRTQAGMNLPVVLHALGFCHYFFMDLVSAATFLKTAIGMLNKTTDPFTLNHVYNGYGLCKQFLCEASEAEGAFRAGLEVATKLGDDSRVSTIMSNMASLKCTMGEYDSAIRMALESIDAARRGLNQPNFLYAYTNLAEAYALKGDVQSGIELITEAKALLDSSHSWRARVAFLGDCANFWLIVGNSSLSLEIISELEIIAHGRERGVPDMGQLERLRIFRGGQVSGPKTAFDMAREAKERFRNRNKMFYLDALSAYAWAERLSYGQVSPATARELKTFDIPELRGKRAALTAQGFLV